MVLFDNTVVETVKAALADHLFRVLSIVSRRTMCLWGKWTVRALRSSGFLSSTVMNLPRGTG